MTEQRKFVKKTKNFEYNAVNAPIAAQEALQHLNNSPIYGVCELKPTTCNESNKTNKNELFWLN